MRMKTVLAVFQSQNVLHIVQPRLAVDPNCGADGAGGEGHAAAGFVGDFDAFAVGGEEGGVVADDVACADGSEADGGRIAWAGVAFAAVNGALFEVAAECVGDDFAHAQGGAAGGVDFVAVVAFDDFDVVAFVEDAGDGVEDVEGEVDADAEVGGEDDTCFFACGLDGGFACVVEAGGADDDVDAFFNAFLQVFEGGLEAGEVDEYVALGEDGINVV